VSVREEVKVGAPAVLVRRSGPLITCRSTSNSLDNDDDLDKARARGQAEGASGEVDTGRIKLDASLHNSLLTSERASALIESINTSCP